MDSFFEYISSIFCEHSSNVITATYWDCIVIVNHFTESIQVMFFISLFVWFLVPYSKGGAPPPVVMMMFNDVQLSSESL